LGNVAGSSERGNNGEERSPSKLCVGIALTTDPGTTRQLLDEFCRALAVATGAEVTARGMWHYHRLLEALDTGEVDLAWLPPILALNATARRRVIPLVLPVRNGVSAYSTALFTRPDSRIRTIADLDAARAAWVDRQSAAGYQIIRAYLRTRGVDLDRAFCADQFLGAHDAVARAVLDGEADVGATFVYMDPDGGGIRHAGWGKSPVHIVAHAGPIPSDVIAATIRMPAGVSRLVQRVLVEGGNPELERTARALLGAEGFVAPLPEHLEPLESLLGGLDEPGATPHSIFPRA
jgi:phosphonate transport system substrate-binding protein